MGIRFVVNFVLLALPIGITLGILLALEKHQAASGKSPFFQDNSWKTVTSCEKAEGIVPPTKGQEYTLNPNQWGWDGQNGSLCMDVIWFNNKTYGKDKGLGPEWSVTWQYPQGDPSAPVHAYPNMKVEGEVFPKKVEDIKNITIDFEWTYGVGKKAVKKNDWDALEAVTLNANVAMDMFLDSDKDNAKDSEKASHEVMVWFAAIGTATQPLGLTKDAQAIASAKNMTIDGVKFGLWYDSNQNDQFVITWMPFEDVDSFTGNLYPLVEEVMKMGASSNSEYSKFPSSSDYIGYMSWGTEAYYSEKNVTFNVAKLSIDIDRE
ncbi:concanavalin A-like lectin/glucanase domain-containing protein [Dactylonectria macrodidyma]|uniref:Concanavalin A-like lectin/glucanase domain-containing protein n=1 Tax=Dactylonectria macrodidyma TaxID=307937 RepID=A0A9P9II76_9HYPO|nr:concanavalin A-like lectin/glucanase domain-containing protein [Dactylonectria macrodidyma]